MHQHHNIQLDVIPIQTAPPDGPVTEASILALLLSIYGPTLSFAELLHVTKVGRSTAGNFKNLKHKRFDPLYPQGFPLFDTTNSPRAFWTHHAAKWLFNRDTNHINSKKA